MKREGTTTTTAPSTTSRLSGFYTSTVRARLETLVRRGGVTPATAEHFAAGGGLDVATADRMSENVIGTHGLPLSVGLNFTINGRDHIVPMAVEEPSVVAAASNAARIVRATGGFVGEADPAVMTAQVQVVEVPHPKGATQRVMCVRDRVMTLGDASIPRVVARGHGCRDIEVRVLDEALGVVVVHVHVDVGDAMGANLVDTVAEAVAPCLHAAVGGTPGLRILTNLNTRRMVRVRAVVDAETLGGRDLADGIARASRFAELDPYRATTHNKGLLNGIDAVAVALGQDWRGIEAGAHAYASMSGQYRPLSVWRRTERGLDGSVVMPLAVGTVGGVTHAHPGVRAAFQLVDVASARELAVVMASVGLASNLSALRALAGEGIQKGHMRLHRRKDDLAPAHADGREIHGGNGTACDPPEVRP